MSLRNYEAGVDAFLETLQKWEHASRKAEQFRTTLPPRPAEPKLAPEEVQKIVARVLWEHSDDSHKRLPYEHRLKAIQTPEVERLIKSRLAAERAFLQKDNIEKSKLYEAAMASLGELRELRDSLRDDLEEWVKIIHQESPSVYPLLPHLKDCEPSLASGWLCRGTLFRRVVISPRYLGTEGYTTLFHMSDGTGGSFGRTGFVEFAPTGQLGVAVDYAKYGCAGLMDTHNRVDPVVVCIRPEQVRHTPDPNKVTILSDALRGKLIKIFRVD